MTHIAGFEPDQLLLLPEALRPQCQIKTRLEWMPWTPSEEKVTHAYFPIYLGRSYW